ncbi:MAG TPA: 30S ribosomal protein S6 [Solirubrobacteraceae bacterium]|nr:30S ribosomal protein S6 [Solirubrobacteraceae bacterium]
MTKPPTVYDLMLVLSATAEEEQRARILAQVDTLITDGGGTVERTDDWHTRPLAYEIRHQGEGEYHLIQFTGPTSILENLTHSLHIEDGVLRFRIIKVLPGTPPPPDAPPAPVAAAVPAES